MAELLRRGYDAQLAHRNTKGYDILVGGPSDQQLRKVQVKTARAQPWYVRGADQGRIRAVSALPVPGSPGDGARRWEDYKARYRGYLKTRAR